MSLMEKVRKAESLSQRGSTRDELTRLEKLKAELYKKMNSDEIAKVAQDSLYRAKNEVRSVCAQIFEDEKWEDCPLGEREDLVEKLIDVIFGFGPLEDLLHDESVTEIMVNGSMSVYFEREGRLYPSSYSFSDDDQVRLLIDRIIGPLGRRVDEASPMVNARLAQGHRVHAIIPPLALDGPVLTIRKFRERQYTLDELEQLNSIDESLSRVLSWAVLSRQNIIVSGATGSGKTTLLNALSCAIPREERIITIEDSAELRFASHPHVVRLEARSRNTEGLGEVSIRELVTNSLRMRPDRIIVGECRGGEALDMLQAMNTGHDGSLTTLHANSPKDAVWRLSTMVRFATEIPINVIELQIASAIDLIVHVARAIDGSRYVQELVALQVDAEATRCEVLPLYRRISLDHPGIWSKEPSFLRASASKAVIDLNEVESWRHQARFIP